MGLDEIEFVEYRGFEAVGQRSRGKLLNVLNKPRGQTIVESQNQLLLAGEIAVGQAQGRPSAGGDVAEGGLLITN